MNDSSQRYSASPLGEHPFSPERPIQRLDEDELGRTDFATQVAKVIASWRNRDSLVLAIYGPWGSGKSSLKNLILDSLEKTNAKTLILEFNPWEWAGQEKVFEGFFSELSTKIGSKDISKNAAKAAKKMRVYGAMLSAAASIYGGVRWLIVAFLVIIGVFGWIPTIENSGIQLTTRLIGLLAFAAAFFLGLFGEIGDKLAAFLSAKAEAARKSVEELKKELHTLLGSLDKNALVVLDDVDRLTPGGIRTVFQLVKANADFPNVVYLLLFQRDTVEKALRVAGESELNGSQYLEKVVQLGFDIPKVSPDLMEESIESSISRILERVPTQAQEKFDAERWAKLFLSAIRPYFRTLRDVKRFGNTLSFHFELYRNGEGFDANPIDLIALEVLRHFEPSLYGRLFPAKALLTGASRSALGLDLSLNKSSIADALIEKVNRPEQATAILMNVFPPFAWARNKSGGTGAGPHAAAYRAEWLNDLRACHPDVFERYFRFSLSTEDVSERDLSSLLAAIGSRQNLVQELKTLTARKLLGAMIIRLVAQPPTVSSESGVSFVGALLDIENELLAQVSKPGAASVPMHIQAAVVIESALRQLPETVRADILRRSIETTNALFLPMVLADQSGGEKLDPLIADEDRKSLREICLNKVRSGNVPDLLKHPALRYILRYWSEWAAHEEVSTWTTEALKSDMGIGGVLAAFVETMTNIADNGRPVSHRFRFALEEFSRYAKPEDLVDRVQHLASGKSAHQQVFELFLRAYSRWKETGHNPHPKNLEDWVDLRG